MFLSGFFCSKKNIWEKGRFFEENHGLTPLQNVDFFWLCENFTFEVQKALFSIQNIKKCFFLPFFAQKKHIRKRSIFWQKPWTNPFAKCQYFKTFLELHFSGLKSIVFYPEYQKMFPSGFFFSKKTYEKKVDFLDKNHGLTPLQYVDFFRLC